MRLQQVGARIVMPVVGVDVGIERTSVDFRQRPHSPSTMITSCVR
jgi:hypothetical protein